MKARLIRREVLPFLLTFGALVAVALLIDALLHVFNAVWIGRYLGIPGTLLILGSLAYSLRKRKLIRSGQPVRLLRLHEGMAWARLACWCWCTPASTSTRSWAGWRSGRC